MIPRVGGNHLPRLAVALEIGEASVPHCPQMMTVWKKKNLPDQRDKNRDGRINRSRL